MEINLKADLDLTANSTVAQDDMGNDEANGLFAGILDGTVGATSTDEDIDESSVGNLSELDGLSFDETTPIVVDTRSYQTLEKPNDDIQTATPDAELIMQQIQIGTAANDDSVANINVGDSDAELASLNMQTAKQVSLSQQRDMDNHEAELAEDELTEFRASLNLSDQDELLTLSEQEIELLPVINELNDFSPNKTQTLHKSTIESVALNTIEQRNNINDLPATQTVKVAQPLGDAKWQKEFNNQVVWLAKQEIKSAQVQVHPPELGPIQVALKMHDQVAQVSFTSEHQIVRDTIEESLADLKQMFSEQGLDLSDASVFDGEQAQEQEAQATQRSADASQAANDAEVTNLASPRRGDGLIDYYA